MLQLTFSITQCMIDINWILHLFGSSQIVLFLFSSSLTKLNIYQVIKENVERTLRNANMKPLSHSSYLRLQVLCQSFYDVDEKLCILHGLSLADLKAFIPELRSQVC